MKHSLRILALSLAMASAATAAPFLAVGDGAELFLTGTLGVRADDNVFLASNKVSDVIFDINPGVDFVFGKGSINQGNFRFTENIARDSQNSDLDTELANISFNSKYDDGKTKFGIVAAYNELNQNTVDTANTGNQLARRDVTKIKVDGETSVTAKSKIGAGAGYTNTNYKRAGYVDQTVTDVPLNYYYAVTSKVDLSLGFRYRHTDLQTGIDSKDYIYTIGARGDFTPKVSGSVAVGVGQRDFDSGSDKSIFSLDSSLDVAMTPKSTLRLTASNDFGVSASGQQQKNFSVGGLISSKISDQLTTKVGLSYRGIDYYARTDDYLEGQLGVDYVRSENVTIIGAYAYRNNSSKLAGSSFNNNVVSLAARFRY